MGININFVRHNTPSLLDPSSPLLLIPHILSYLQTTIFDLHNKMHKKLKSTLTGKTIPRLKMVNCREQSLSQHRHPKINYFDKIGGHRSYLTLAAGEQQQFKTPKNKQQINGNTPYASKMFDLSLQGLRHSQNTLTSFLTKTQNAQANLSSSIHDSKDELKLPQAQPTPANKYQQYMTYHEYQELIADGRVQPGHFQALARRNDRQRVVSSAEEAKSSQGIQKKKEGIAGQSSKALNIGGVRAKRHKHLTDVSVVKLEPATIINTQVGALSNIAIREALEHKWTDQLNHKNRSMAFTQESDQRSEKDNKKGTIKDQFIPSQKKPIYSKNLKVLPLKKNQGKKVMVGKYSRLFQRIYPDFASQQKPLRVDSYGDQYSAQEQKLMHFDDVYRVKKAVLKHKLDWKV